MPVAPLLLIALPAVAAAEASDGRDVVAEAFFLADTLPPGGRELDLAVALEREPAGEVAAAPTLQLATPLGERAGVTVDVGVGAGGLERPGAAVKVLLREADPGATGLSASVDWHASPGPAGGGEVTLAVGALRRVGRIGLRATLLAVNGTSAWRPLARAGLSAAAELSRHVRVLAEVAADPRRGDTAISAGPTLKVSIGDAALMAGAMLEVGRPGRQAFAVQLARSL